MSSETKVWFITGCSSGLGLCVAEHALKKGDRVVATLRKPEALSELAAKYPETLLLLKLDVTKPAEVAAAFAAAQDRFCRVDVVVNNAGLIVIGEVESMPDSAARDIMEVNFWGALNVTKEAARFFREVNRPMGGRLIQVSSLAGLRSSAAGVYYCVSKSALDSLSEGIADEFHPDWNIKVTILELGPFQSKCSSSAFVSPVHPAYNDPTSRTMQWRGILASTDSPFNSDPEKVADAVHRLAYLEDPPLRMPIHSITLATLRETGKQLIEVADKWESWSEDIMPKQ